MDPFSASNPPPYPVTSVAGKTGAVTLAESDIPALSISKTTGLQTALDGKMGSGLTPYMNTTIPPDIATLIYTASAGTLQFYKPSAEFDTVAYVKLFNFSATGTTEIFLSWDAGIAGTNVHQYSSDQTWTGSVMLIVPRNWYIVLGGNRDASATIIHWELKMA